MATFPYWIFPLISAFVWVGMLISMLVYWCATGKPHYASMEAGQNIAYISDVGADLLKPLFIAGSSVTTVFLDLSFLSERWLRHTGKLAKNTTKTEKVLSGLAIFFAIVGTCGLILLSIFDTLRHPKLHDIFLLLFIAGYVLAAIFMCAEYQRLGIHFRQHRILRISFWVKLVFIIVELILAIAFVVCNFHGAPNAAAVLEWAVAFIFTFWVLSFVLDLAPVSKDKQNAKYAGSETEMQAESNDAASERHRDQHNNSTTNSNTVANGLPPQMHTGDAYTANGVQYVQGPNGLQPKTTLANNF